MANNNKSTDKELISDSELLDDIIKIYLKVRQYVRNAKSTMNTAKREIEMMTYLQHSMSLLTQKQINEKDDADRRFKAELN